jgi:catechol 2,3-dioxygenase-like lactoylglutathione lyase family enzyme
VPGGAVFAAGDVKVLVHERSRGTADGPANEDHFAFGVADVDAACDGLRAQGVSVLIEARDYPWGRSAYLRDPDGRLLELSQT